MRFLKYLYNLFYFPRRAEWVSFIANLSLLLKCHYLKGCYILLCAIILSLKTFKVISMLSFLSSALMSATNQVYQSLAKLIRLCDDVLLFGDKAISQENVTEVVKLVEDAVQVLPYTFI